jgi:hypothetical protein
MPLKRWTYISLSAYNASAIVAVKVTIRTKKSLKFVKYYYVSSFRATVDTLHVHVSVARIAKEKISFYLILTTTLILNFKSGKPTVEIFRTTGQAKFLHIICCV